MTTSIPFPKWMKIKVFLGQTKEISFKKIYQYLCVYTHVWACAYMEHFYIDTTYMFQNVHCN
jgi:hypothetical protein